MPFRDYLYRPVPVQVCDGFVCLTDPQLCQAVTSTFLMSEKHSEVSRRFIFCVGCRSRIYILLLLLFFNCCGSGVKSDVKCGSASVSEVHTDSSPSVLPDLLVPPLPSFCPLRGPKPYSTLVSLNSHGFLQYECQLFKLFELLLTSRMSVFLSLIPMHFLPSIHLHARGKRSSVLHRLYWISLSFTRLSSLSFRSPLFGLTPFLLPPLFKKWHLSLVVALFYHIMLVGMILESNNLPVYIF